MKDEIKIGIIFSFYDSTLGLISRKGPVGWVLSMMNEGWVAGRVRKAGGSMPGAGKLGEHARCKKAGGSTPGAGKLGGARQVLPHGDGAQCWQTSQYFKKNKKKIQISM